MFCTTAVGLLLCLANTAALLSQPPSLLPFVTSDAVLQRHPLTGETIRLTGVIEDLTADVVELRRSGSRVERLRLQQVTQIQFIKSPDFDRGLVHLQRNELAPALAAFDQALPAEQRIWVQRELQAAAAEALLGMGRKNEVLQRVQKIVETDPATRHVGLLPLVWDSSLPQSERFPATPEGLNAGSRLLQLVTASVLLDSADYEVQAAEVLTKLRVNSRPHLQELAEAQLWRLRLLHPEQLRKIDTKLWSDRVQEFGAAIRSGPEYVLGQAFMQQHDYDSAAIHLMWPATMPTVDQRLIEDSLKAAAIALQKSGRPAEAALARQTLADRFPQK